MDEDQNKSYKLSIYLLKEEIKDYRSALKENVSIEREYTFKSEIKSGGIIIIGATKSNQSNWRDLLQEAVDSELPELNNTSNRAVVFLTIQKRIFALPFGYGKHLIRENVIDKDFGLRTVLNVINADKLVSVDKASLNDLSLLTRTQTSRKGGPQAFNIDIIRDLLTSVTGEPAIACKSDFGKVITGNVGISMIPTIHFSDIPNYLNEIYTAYSSKRYKERFDWIDNISPEKDPDTVAILKSQLLDDIKSRNDVRIQMAPPFIIDWESFEGFSYTPMGELETDFDITNFYEQKEKDLDQLNLEKLYRLKLFLKRSDVEERSEIPFWRCLNYQTDIASNLYVLLISKWYKVNKKYSEDIVNYANQIQESDLKFIDCKDGIHEGEYNENLAKSRPEFKLLDKELVRSDLARSGIEVCDVISNTMEFIHVKFRKSSATLSHLFAQGRVSANLLRRDETFRKNLREKFDEIGLSKNLVPIDSNKVNASNYTITFAIIDKKKRTFVESLPFFSLLTFRLAAEDLQLLGYNVKVKKIDII